MLSPHGFQCANKSIGWWRYDLPNMEKPLVARYCSVAKTLGNRRLGDNVLTGLERLLPYLVDLGNISELYGKFPEERCDSETSSWAVFPTSLVSLTCCFGGELDFHDFPFQEIVPIDFRYYDRKWTHIWKECIVILEKYYGANPAKKQSLLAHIYWRFGYEVGTICRIFKLAEFSWGTYSDVLGHHCNSHVNNLVLLPFSASNPTSPLLAPLDFDMAFTKSSFSRDSVTWSGWMTMEENGMKMVLGGDTQLSTGVTAVVGQLSQGHSLVRDALRDTMVCAFNHALNGQANPHPTIPAIGPEIHSLLKLALIVTERETA